MQFRLIIYLLCFKQTSTANISKDIISEQQFQSDAELLCPYTSFCEENIPQPFLGSDEKIPCCHDCSCGPSCGLTNNCCFKHLDVYKREETYHMICKSTKTYAKSLKDSLHFMMLHKCFAFNKSYNDIQKSDALFHPVYSSKTGFIYFNTEVASCNDATDLVPFQKAISCNFQEDFMNNVDRILKGLEPSSECQIQYQPPKGIDLKSEECKPNVIRKCNVTGKMKAREPFWTFCESFNATFVLQVSNQEYVYGNMYCYMCNDLFHRYKFRKDLHTCKPVLDKNDNLKLTFKLKLTVILKEGLQYVDEDTLALTGTSGSCPQHMIVVNSFTVNRK